MSPRPRSERSSRPPPRHWNQQLRPIDLSSATAAAAVAVAGADNDDVAGAVVVVAGCENTAAGSEPNFSARTAAEEDPSTEKPDLRSWVRLDRHQFLVGTSLYYYSSLRFRFQTHPKP